MQSKLLTTFFYLVGLWEAAAGLERSLRAQKLTLIKILE